MREILSAGLTSARILAASASMQSLEPLRGGGVRLLIVDVPWFDADYCNLITSAKELAPEVPILVTSTGRRSDIVSNVWRLGVQD